VLICVVKSDGNWYTKEKKRKEVSVMPNIKPISDLRNYTEVLKETSEGAPVFLTKNGRGEYVILDMKDYDKMKATLTLMSELEKGERSAREEGWLSADEVEKALGLI
jgi:prevent-host-death family protein